MTRLIAASPVGKNGQTVVPASVRKMFHIREGHNLVGFFLKGDHVEIAPIEVSKVDYTVQELDKIENLTKQRKGKVFKNSSDAKDFVKGL